MRHAVSLAILSTVFCAAAASAQSGWDKSYNVSSRPSLQIDVDDPSVRVRSCGGCRTVHVHVDPRGGDLSRWRITDMQGGSGIRVSVRHIENRNFLGWSGRAPEVTVETPAESDLQVRAGDGSVAAAGLRGSVDVKTGDGSVQAQEIAGPLRISTGDGSVQVHRAEGTLAVSTGDGSMIVEGRFTQVDARSGDGSIRMNLLPGSVLESGSRISSGDGSIALTVPRDLRADVQANSGDGSIANGLPLQSAASNERHSVRGLMNGGGPTLRIQSGDGSIAMNTR